jgi:site-specific DNA-methyltransferase (adenine-specific)
MPIFLKGDSPLYFNKETLKIPCKQAGKVKVNSTVRRPDGTTVKFKKEVVVNPTKCRGTVWECDRDGPKIKQQHPAAFPDKMACDLITCFCPPDGLVLDPFMGSGTTARMALKAGRHYLGYEISAEYCALAEKIISES